MVAVIGHAILELDPPFTPIFSWESDIDDNDTDDSFSLFGGGGLGWAAEGILKREREGLDWQTGR